MFACVVDCLLFVGDRGLSLFVVCCCWVFFCLLSLVGCLMVSCSFVLRVDYRYWLCIFFVGWYGSLFVVCCVWPVVCGSLFVVCFCCYVLCVVYCSLVVVVVCSLLRGVCCLVCVLC